MMDTNHTADEAPIRELLLRRVPQLLKLEGAERLEQFRFVVGVAAKRVTDGRIRRGSCIATLLEVAARGDVPNNAARHTIRQTLGQTGRPRRSARYYAKHKFKKTTSTNNAKQKKRGRPATGVTPMMGVRISKELRGRIESWARSRPDGPSLSEAIRRLIELALKSPKRGPAG